MERWQLALDMLLAPLEAFAALARAQHTSPDKALL